MKDKHRQDSYFKSCKCIVNIARSLFKLNVCTCLISICSSHKILFFFCVFIAARIEKGGLIVSAFHLFANYQ